MTAREIRSRRRRQTLKLSMALRREDERRGVRRSFIGLPGEPWGDPERWRAWQIGHHAGRLFALREAGQATQTKEPR